MFAPPYQLNDQILSLCTQISQLLGKSEGLKLLVPSPQLRRQNRIKSIQSSLSIEGNSLSLEQVSAILDKKKVIGHPKEILEVQNAIQAYEGAQAFTFHSLKSFLNAHKILLHNLIPDAGKWRQKGIGIFQGKRVIHMAPPASRVPHLMTELFHYLKSAKKTNFLLLSAVIHYEIEFIHPFSDGNGRMGRLWQHIILLKHHPFFEFLPVESLIKKHQADYYKALRSSDKAGECSDFIEFCLQMILESMEETLAQFKVTPLSSSSRLELAKTHFRNRSFTRKDYIHYFKNLSTATASRDLSEGVGEKVLKKEGDKARTVYRYL